MTIYRLIQGGSVPSGESWTSRIHVQSSAALAAVAADWVTAVGVLWAGDGEDVDGMGTLFPTTVTTSRLVTDQLDELTGRATFQVIDSAAIAGTAVAGPLPQEVSVVATLRTAGIGPSQRGRIYLPPVANDSVTAAGRLQTASQTTIVEAVAGMLNSLLDQGHVPVIYHPSNLAGDPVTSVDVGDVFDAQRRRRDKLIEVRISRTVE